MKSARYLSGLGCFVLVCSVVLSSLVMSYQREAGPQPDPLQVVEQEENAKGGITVEAEGLPPEANRPTPVPPASSRRRADTGGPDAGPKRASEVPPQRRRAAFGSLQSYAGKDLAQLPEGRKGELRDALATLLPDRKVERHVGFQPQHFWPFGQKRSLYLLFEVYGITFFPGTTVIRLTLFDDSGKVLGETTLGTGHRCYLRSAELWPAAQNAYPLLLLTTGPDLLGSFGPDIAKQWYAWIGGRFDLIRLEDGDGKVTRNRYQAQHSPCGPPLLRQTAQQWEADLLSGDPGRSLRAMVWLGGTHYRLDCRKEADSAYETVEDILQVRAVRSRAKVRACLTALAGSEDRWLREAARLALDPEDYPQPLGRLPRRHPRRRS